MGVFERLRLWITGAPVAQKVDLGQDFKAYRAGSVVDIAVPHDALLVRDVTLPKLTGTALTRAVELDAIRATPFQAETISISQAVLDKTKDSVSVRQFVARNSDLEGWIERAKHAGLSVRAVFPSDMPSARLADFSNQLMQKTALWRKVNVSLVVVIALLAGVALWRPVVALQEEQRLAEAKVVELRSEAARLQSQIAGIENRSFGLRMISARQADAAAALERVDRLTTALPDDAWIVHVALDADTMRLTGNVTGDPLSLLVRLAAAPGFGSPVLTTSFALNDGTGGQRFEIEVPLEEGQP